MTEARQTYHYIVSGRVQGVGYRWFTKHLADTFGMTGTVENLDNGDVEIFASGTPQAQQQFIEKLHEGPSYGLVHEIQAVPIERRDFPCFSILVQGRRW